MAGALLAWLPAGAYAETVVLEHFTLIDGTGQQPRSGQSIVIIDGRLVEVGPADTIKIPADARRTDLRGKFVMPGLIDAHVHLGLVNGIDQNFTKFYDRENIEERLKVYSAYGVTSVNTNGTDGDETRDLVADQRRQCRIDRARVFAGGRGVVYEGGYGGVPGLEQQVATPEETAEMVRREIGKGSELIKLWMDDEFGNFPLRYRRIDRHLTSGRAGLHTDSGPRLAHRSRRGPLEPSGPAGRPCSGIVGQSRWAAAADTSAY